MKPCRTVKLDIFYLLFIILPFLDSLNGYLIRVANVTIGPIYHLAYGIALLFVAFIEKKGYVPIRIIYISVLFFSNILFSVCLNQLLSVNSALDISRMIKYINTFVYIISLYIIVDCEKEVTKKIFNYSSLAIPLILLVLRITNLGYFYYADGVSGYVGWYMSLDELVTILTVLLMYSLMTFKSSVFICYVRVVLIALCMILVSSKASFIILAVSVLVRIFYEFFQTLKMGGTKRKTLFYTLMIALVGVFVVIPVFNRIKDDFVTRQSYLYQNKSTEGLLNYISSGRVLKIEEYIIQNIYGMDEKNQFLSLIRTFFGNGFMHHSYFGFKAESHIEMDFFDSYYWVGVIGVVLYMLFFIITFVEMRKTQTSFNKYLPYFISFSVSFFIGHVIFAGVASIYFSLFMVTICKVNLFDD